MTTKLTEFMGYSALTSAPDQKAVWGHFLATYMDECQERFDRWLAEYTRQQREEAVTNLENGVLPEGYMIVSVRDLTDSVIRALKEVTK